MIDGGIIWSDPAIVLWWGFREYPHFLLCISFLLQVLCLIASWIDSELLLFIFSSISPGTNIKCLEKMSKPAVLLIGKLTHVKKEWEDCASFAELKVCIFEIGKKLCQPMRRHIQDLPEQNFWTNARKELIMMWSRCIGAMNRHR
jgi:hypothetical protein